MIHHHMEVLARHAEAPGSSSHILKAAIAKSGEKQFKLPHSTSYAHDQD